MIPTRRLALNGLLSLAATPAFAQDKATLEAAFKVWEGMQTEWLAKNLAKPGWQATASGLQYKRTIAQEAGRRPTLEDDVIVKYTTTMATAGTLDRRVDPIRLPVASLMRGMREAILMMRAGETWEFAVPGALAYGDKAVGDQTGKLRIPPNSALVWHVELVRVPL